MQDHVNKYADMTLAEVGRQLGVSRQRVHQIQKLALQKLKSELQPDTLEPSDADDLWGVSARARARREAAALRVRLESD